MKNPVKTKMKEKKSQIISPSKAQKILHEKEVKGQPLTEKQRKFFGARASGYPVKKEQRDMETGGSISTELDKIYSFADSNNKLVEEKSNLYELARQKQWDRDTLYKHFKNIFSYMAEIAYNNQYPDDMINLNSDRNKFTERYVNEFFKSNGNENSTSEVKSDSNELLIDETKEEQVCDAKDESQNQPTSFEKGGKIEAKIKKIDASLEQLNKSLNSSKTTGKAKEKIEKKIKSLQDKLRELNTPKGNFYVDIPIHYKRKMLSLLKEDGIKFSSIPLDNKTRILVNTKDNENKVIDIYSKISSEKNPQPVSSGVMKKMGKKHLIKINT